MNEDEFHAQFANKESVNLLPIVLKTCFSTSKAVFEKPPVKEWSTSYHLMVKATQNFLTNFSKAKKTPIHLFQTLTNQPKKIPKGAIVTQKSFKVNESVVNFIREKAPGEWPSHASTLSTIPGEVLYDESSKPSKTIYFLHGGAYIGGCCEFFRPLVYKIAKGTCSEIVSINYRLAPQNPYPCGLIDAVSGYLEILESVDPQNIIFMGDSAGGGLVMAALLVLRDMKKPLPAGAFCLSPWVDLTHSFPSFFGNSKSDLLPDPTSIKDPKLGDRKFYYTINEYLDHPYVSPYFGSFRNFPPILIQCGGVERLFDENLAIFDKLKKEESAGPTTLEIYSGHVHVFQIAEPAAATGEVAVERAIQWMQTIGEQQESKIITLSFDGASI